MINENAQNVHLEFLSRHCRRQTPWALLVPPRLTGVVQQDFLRNVLPELLQSLDPQTGIYLWFMHDYALPHFLLTF